MPFFYFDYYYLLLVVPALLITVWALNTHSLKYLDDKESHPDPIPFVPDAERI